MSKFKSLLANIGGCILLGSVIDIPAFSKDWFIMVMALILFNAAGGYYISEY